MKPLAKLPPKLGDEHSLYWFALQAKAHLLTQPWCDRIVRGYLAIGWENLLGVFYFRVHPTAKGGPDQIWVVSGDVPPACLSCDNASTAALALQAYDREMRRWIDAVRAGRPTAGLVPVRPASDPMEFADLLAHRLSFITESLLNSTGRRDSRYRNLCRSDSARRA
jgi:hypothetical protein